MRARDIMSSPVITVTPRTTIKEAARTLATHGFTALPVVADDDRLVGIVTEADVVRGRIPLDPRAHILPGYQEATGPVTTTVGEVMTTRVTAMEPGADVALLAAALIDAKQRSMPIVEGSRLVGIVTRRDVVATVGRDDATVATDVRHRLELYGGPGRWTVECHEGVVTIGDRLDDATDRHVVSVLAEAVPGVVRAKAVAVPDEG
jgi:CBS-domain-containing membrane protein